MRGRAAALVALLTALAVAGCGGDDPTVQATTPARSATTTTPASTATTPARTTPTRPGYSAAPQQPGEGSGSHGRGSSGGGSGNGGAAPPASGGSNGGNGGASAPEDSAGSDQPAPPGSPASRYEQFCKHNPDACR